MRAAETKAVVAALHAQGTSVRFVGGAVRDAVLGRPTDDIDIATPDPPDTVTGLLEAAEIAVDPTGVDHGTVTATIGSYAYQITSLRIDVETDGRHAKVAFTRDWTRDASRRDFTVNALFSTPDGNLYDPFGGVADLRAGLIRFIGDPVERIREDGLRLLRYFRFFAHYGRPPADRDTLAACREMVGVLENLSPERIRDEMLKLLAAPDPAGAMAFMRQNRILQVVLPEATRLDRLRALSVIERENPDIYGTGRDDLRRLAAVVDCYGDGAERIAERLRLSKSQIRRLVAMAAPVSPLSDKSGAEDQRRALYRIGRETFADVVCLSWSEALSNAFQEWENLASHYGAMLAGASEWSSPSLPVGGDDVLAAGVPEGPGVARVLKRVEDWWIADDFKPGREAALAKLAELVSAQTS